MSMNKLTPFEIFDLTYDLLRKQCIYKGSFVLYVLLLSNNIEAKRYVKDLDIMVYTGIEQNKIANQIENILLSQVSEKEVITSSSTSNGVIQIKSHTFKESLNKIKIDNLIDIVGSKSIEFKEYNFKNKSLKGSSQYQMITDKLNPCATVKYGRIEKDLNDLRLFIENFNFNLLDLLDCINLNKQNLSQYEYIIQNVSEVSKLLNLDNITFHNSQEFNEFIIKMNSARSIYKQLGIKYDNNKIIQREYAPLYERFPQIQVEYELHYLKSNKIANTLSVNWI